MRGRAACCWRNEARATGHADERLGGERGPDSPGTEGRTRHRSLPEVDGAVRGRGAEACHRQPPGPGPPRKAGPQRLRPPDPSTLRTRLNPGSGSRLPSVGFLPSAVAPLTVNQPACLPCRARCQSLCPPVRGGTPAVTAADPGTTRERVSHAVTSIFRNSDTTIGLTATCLPPFICV